MFAKKNIKVHLTALLLILFSLTAKSQTKEGAVKLVTNKNIDNLISQKLNYNKNLKTIKGYKIQLFFGSEKNSYKVKEEFEAVYPKYKAQIVFSSPQWKVQVGSYKTRLEADRDLVEIKNEYPGAIIVTTDIDLD